MAATKPFCPDWASAPGGTISDVLRERRISVSDFAALIGLTTDQAADLLAGRAPITIALARRLESVLGGSVAFWMARDYRYRQQIEQQNPTGNEWMRELPWKDMVDFGWVRPARRESEQLAACLEFFHVPSIAAWHRQYANVEQRFSFRTSPTFQSNPAALSAWLRKGEIEAAAIECASWSAQGLTESLGSIRSLTRSKDPHEFLPVLQRLCAENGVAVAIVRAPSGCRASGATRFISKNKAMLLLSFRFLSDDQFWFSFFHEVGHLLLHSHQDLFVEGEEVASSRPEEEASEFASRILVPVEHKSELLRLRQSPFEIARFARMIGVSPGIIVGQLQHYGKIKQNHFNKLKRRYTW